MFKLLKFENYLFISYLFFQIKLNNYKILMIRFFKIAGIAVGVASGIIGVQIMLKKSGVLND